MSTSNSTPPFLLVVVFFFFITVIQGKALNQPSLYPSASGVTRILAVGVLSLFSYNFWGCSIRSFASATFSSGGAQISGGGAQPPWHPPGYATTQCYLESRCRDDRGQHKDWRRPDPKTIFVDQNHSLDLTSSGLNRVEIWNEGNISQRTYIATGWNQSQGLVVSSAGDLFVQQNTRQINVERWRRNLSNGTTVLTDFGNSFTLFLGPMTRCTARCLISISSCANGFEMRERRLLTLLAISFLVLFPRYFTLHVASSFNPTLICTSLIRPTIAFNSSPFSKETEARSQAMASLTTSLFKRPSESSSTRTGLCSSSTKEIGESSFFH